MRTVNITCENTHQEYEIELGTTLRDVKKIIFPENHNHILGAWSIISYRTCSSL